MSNNKKPRILTEGTARRWATLAKVNLSEGFIREMYEEEENKKLEQENMKVTTDPITGKSVREAQHTKFSGEKFEKDPLTGKSVRETKKLEQEIKTKEQARARGDTDRLNEMGSPALPENETEEAPTMPPEGEHEPEMHHEPDGDESMGGVDVKELVAAIADAITAKTGVEVDVEGEPAGEAGAEEMPETEPEGDEMPGKETEGMEGHEAGMPAHMRGYEEGLNEAASKPAESNQGKVQDPGKPSGPQLRGPGKPLIDLKGKQDQLGAKNVQKDMAYKALEEQITQRVLARLVESVKVLKENNQKKKK